jgi:hypothetical protein
MTSGVADDSGGSAAGGGVSRSSEGILRVGFRVLCD